MHTMLDAYPVVMKIPVRWGDMDAFNHVNNVVYFQYFESARINYFERVRLMGPAEGQGIGPILHSTRCRFRFPVTYPEILLVGARVTEIGIDRFTQQYLAVSAEHDRVAAEGHGVIVAFDYRSQEKSPIPEEVRRRILELEPELGR